MAEPRRRQRRPDGSFELSPREGVPFMAAGALVGATFAAVVWPALVDALRVVLVAMEVPAGRNP